MALTRKGNDAALASGAPALQFITLENRAAARAVSKRSPGSWLGVMQKVKQNPASIRNDVLSGFQQKCSKSCCQPYWLCTGLQSCSADFIADHLRAVQVWIRLWAYLQMLILVFSQAFKTAFRLIFLNHMPKLKYSDHVSALSSN